MSVDSILAACSNLTYFAMHTGDSFHHRDNKSRTWSAEDIDAILILPWACSLEALELTGMLPVCHRDDDAAKGFSKSHQDDSRDAHDSTNCSQSAYQESVREEITQDMDVDKNS